jgi:DNA-binding SARP family transcriptional activator
VETACGASTGHRDGAASLFSLDLLGAFALRIGDLGVNVARGSQRLLALLALRKRMDRRLLAGTLWPDRPEERAAANLRAAAWRLPRHGQGIVVAEAGKVSLHRGVDCDVHRLESAAFALLHAPEPAACFVELFYLRDELLPDWDEEWLTLEREWLRQLRLESLDLLAKVFTDADRCAEAVLVAMMAVRTDPLRESSQRLLVAAHQANGNRSQALQQYRNYSTLLQREFGAEPAFPMPCFAAGQDRAITVD